jgi:hypothetical protein
MPMKKHKPDQIVALLRQVGNWKFANGKTTPLACKEAEITALSLCFGLRHHLPRSFRGVR